MLRGLARALREQVCSSGDTLNRGHGLASVIEERLY